MSYSMSGRRLRAYADPYRTVARFSSVCCVTSCQAKIKAGDSIVYDRDRKKVYCIHCGAEILDNIRAEKSMEQYGTDIF